MTDSLKECLFYLPIATAGVAFFPVIPPGGGLILFLCLWFDGSPLWAIGIFAPIIVFVAYSMYRSDQARERSNAHEG